jgi:hypothetical protein
MCLSMPKPDLYYLYQNSERLLQNAKERGSYEQKISGLFGQNQ